MKSRNLKLFYLHELLFQFSDTMLILVLPVFIYKLFGEVSAVFLFIMAWNLIHGILFLPVFNLAMKLKHPKYFMMIGIVFYVTALSVFSMTTITNKWMIIPGLIIFALYISFYWVMRHWFISVNSDYKVIGRQMSIIYLIKTLIAFLAPITGGVISYLFSFNATFVVGVVAASLSLIPIALFNAEPHPERFSYKKMITTLKKREISAISPAYFCEGVAFVSIGTVWILLFALFIGNILDLGLLMGMTTLITGLTIWMTGTWFDKRSRAHLLTRVSKIRTLTVMTYATIFFLPQIAYVWAIEFINRLTQTMQSTVMESYLYAYGNKISSVDFMLSREVYLNLSRFLTSGILALLFFFLPENYLWIVIFLGSFSVLGQIYVKRSDHHLI